MSIEHHAAWFAKVRQALQDDRLHYRLFKPTVPEPDPPGNRRERGAVISAWMLRCEREPDILRDYVSYPATLGLTFDLVLVDGRARVYCLAAGWELLRPGGVLLLHDAQRPEYRETLHRLGRPVFLEPWRQGQICLLRKPEPARA